MPDEHARLSPSGAHRWMRCPASLAAERGIIEHNTSHAIEGTAAHAVAEQVLKALNPKWADKRPKFSRTKAADFVGEKIEGWVISDDMIPPIQSYIDTIMGLAHGNLLYIEQRIEFSDLVNVPNSFGTADAVIISSSELQIHDLKFGRGIKVEAYQNYQLLIYALGALQIYELVAEIITVRLFIHQPRLNHVSEWALTVQELREFGEKVKAAAAKAIACYQIAEDGRMLSPDDFQPSATACRWCKAAPTCKAHANHVYELVAGEFVDVDAAEFDAIEPHKLTPEQLAAAYANADYIEAWCGKVRKEAFKRLSEGERLPGLKIVKGRPGNRKWSDERAAELLLLLAANDDDIYTRKLITPTQAEKLLKTKPDTWEQAQALITRADGSPIVVPESDRRPALAAGAEMFEKYSD